MSKRKQIRPSKFDIWKKDEDPLKPMTLTESRDDDADKEAGSESQHEDSDHEKATPGSGQSENTDNADSPQVVTVARTALSSVIQSTSRKRTISALESAVIRHGSGRRMEAAEANGEVHDDIDRFSPHLEAQQKTNERLSVSREQEKKRARIVVETPRLSLDLSHVLLDGRQLERSISEQTDALRPADRRQPLKCFVCPYCETGFSNPKTLEAHQTIYCTKKPLADGKSSPNAPAKRTKLPSSVSPSHDGHHATTSADPHETQAGIGRVHRNSSTIPNVRVTSPESVPAPPSMSAPSVILLPCAYSRSNVVQIIGKPQTIIPVAVPRAFATVDFPVTPLMLEESWCTAIDILDYKVPLSNAFGSLPSSMNGSSAKPHFSLPLATRAAFTEAPITVRSVISNSLAPHIKNGRPRSSEDGPDRKLSVESRTRSPPLDLTKKGFADMVSPSELIIDGTSIKRRSLPQLKVNPITDSATAPPKTAPTPPLASSAAFHPKNYGCPKCGVAFSSRKTLEGHQAYYCKALKSTEEHTPDQSSSSSVQKEHSNQSSGSQSLCCQYCDQTTATVWQLLQHMKNAHSLGAAYLCTLCGYRGFSMRGMKSHLKHAHADEATLGANHDEEDFVAKFVRRTRLFDEYETAEADEEASRSTDSRSEIDVDDCHVESLNSKDRSSPVENSVRKLERNQEADNSVATIVQKAVVTEGQPSTSTTCPTLVSKYACQFCAYKSPYKGNVKRHLALVHKMEKHKPVD